MQFYDSTNKRAICQEIDRLCDTTDTSYPRLDKTSRVNDALERVLSWIITADGTWQFDDENYTTHPIGTGTLVSGQHEYTFTDKILDIESVSILDLNGIYRQITPFDSSEVGESFEEYFGVDSGEPQNGIPQYYDKVGNSIFLDKNPTSSYVTLASGIKVRFKRTASLFTATSATSADTTVPGFASPFHVILAYMASIPYCMTYKKDRVAAYLAFVGDTFPLPTGMKKDIIELYSHREKDKRSKMTMASINFR